MMRGFKTITLGATGLAGIAAALSGVHQTKHDTSKIVVVPASNRAASVAMGTSTTAARAAVPAAALVSSTYIVSEDEIPNPERGVYRWAWEDADLIKLTPDDVQAAYAENYRLLFVRLRLDAYRTKAIPQSFLDKLDPAFNVARDNGVKLIVRAVYNNPQSETEYQNVKDASLSQVKAHLNQLKPYLQKNSDVIAFMQAGFVGAWGEWHTSSNNLTADPARTQVKDALLAAVPVSRPIQFRYPPHLQAWAPTLPSLDSAITGSFRLGFINDCFLASDTDVGTYDEDPTIRAQQKDYIARLTALTPFGGETCNPADEAGAAPRTSCNAIQDEGALYHLTYLNNEYYTEIFHDQWKNVCLDKVKRTMGYRFELRRSSHDNTIARGATFKLNFSVKNSGWARLYNQRLVQIVLRNTSTGVVTRINASGTDPRRWLPSTAAADVNASAVIPSNLAVGSYAVMLALPDPSAALTNKPAFAIRFANRDNGAQAWQPTLGAFATGTTLQVN